MERKAAESEFRRLHALGMTTGQIARELAIPESTSNKIRRRLGLAVIRQCQKGEENRAWKGGRRFDKSGYILVYMPGHPHARKGMVREHRLVSERVLGRLLLPSEVVDHIDGNRSNNAVENLRVFQTNALHLSETLKGKVPRWTPGGKERMRLAVIRSNIARGLARKRDVMPTP